MTAPAPMFPPTLREVLLRPRWIGMLLFALVVAGVFAWLGQWQMARAIDTDPPEEGATEQVLPLEDVLDPGDDIPEPQVGQRVEVEGSFVPGDFYVVSGRFNDGVAGYWVSGQLRIDDADASIAVAVGFADDQAAAQAAADELNAAEADTVTVTGRLISDEGATAPSRSQPITAMARMSPAQLINIWNDTDGIGVYRPYLASQSAFGPLDEIASPAPQIGSPINWLNVFYAVEWIVFAGFAFYLWFRLAKDAWEREVEDFEEAQLTPA